ncbi:hypothetical protein Dcar01_03008 [Deinococcus carri]|uniref:Lipoprotein n=1 Tax=Deinococcus carri TaxID=1211323 RepID=A0ABP9WDT3_9DEIO
MKRTLLLLPLALASCGLFGTPSNYDVTGTLTGTPPTAGNVRLALLGASLGGVVNANVPQIDVSLGNRGVFGVDWPAAPAEGLYQVIAYVDTNSDRQYNSGEPRTHDNQKYLVYSRGGALADLVGLKAGWNLVNTSTTPFTVTQPGRVTGYDLNW